MVRSKDTRSKDTRSKEKREQDRETIARQYLQGRRQGDIAAELGITQQQVSYDLKVIRQRWLDSSVRNFDEAKSEELAKIDAVEAEFWKAWEASTKTKTTVTRKSKSIPVSEGETPISIPGQVETKVEQQIGNPAFLAGVMSCIQKRCQIMGFDNEIKMQSITAALEAVVRAGYNVEQLAASESSEGEAIGS